MTEKKQNKVKKTTVGKKVNHLNPVGKFSANQDTQTETSTNETLADLIARLEKNSGQRNLTIHIHMDTSTVNNVYKAIPTSEENALLSLLIKIAPLMVKDSSITAVDFIIAVIKEVPSMVKDSSITEPELWDTMVKVRDTLLAAGN